jgi:hypothetical protein
VTEPPGPDDARLLAAASERLRGEPGWPQRPGRPRTRAVAWKASARSKPLDVARPSRARVPAVCPEPTATTGVRIGQVERVLPRLLDLRGTAAYLALGPRSVRDLEAAGALVRVRVPGPGGEEVRKLLFDRLPTASSSMPRGSR